MAGIVSTSGDVDELLEDWTVVDVQRELGVEPGVDSYDVGAEINNYLDKDGTDDVLFTFPAGNYRFNSTVDCREYERIGYLGKGDVTLEVTDDTLSGMFMHARGGSGYATAFYASGFTIDITATGVGPHFIRAAADDYIEISNIDVVGQRALGDNVYVLNPRIATEQGQFVIEDVRMPDGSVYDSGTSQTSHPIGIAVEPDHVGSGQIRRCYLEGWMNNGVYDSRHHQQDGLLLVENTHVVNCGNSAIRLGSNARAENCTIENHDTDTRGYDANGLWLDGADNVYVDGLRVDATEDLRHAIRVHGSSSDGYDGTYAGEIRNVYMDRTGDGYSFFLSDNGGEKSFLVENAYIIDRGGGSVYNHSIHVQRPDVTFRDVHVETTTSGRNGALVDADKVWFDSCTLDVPTDDYPILYEVGADRTWVTDCNISSGPIYLYNDTALTDFHARNNDMVPVQLNSGTISNYHVSENAGWNRTEIGSVSIANNGTTTYDISHNLDGAPDHVSLTPQNAASIEYDYFSYWDSAVIRVEYTTAPSGGPIEFSYRAKIEN